MGEASKRPKVVGYAIVSREGMIANADGSFPEGIKIDADQKFFHGSLRRASAIANGKHSNEGGPDSFARPRLILTRKIASLAPHSRNPKALLWNPKGASLEEAWKRLGAPGDVLAVVGGTEVFGLFLELGYDDFFLSRADASVPYGRPVFPGGLTPEKALKRGGMTLKETHVLDQASNTTVEHWARK